jgi:hypothetical protein
MEPFIIDGKPLRTMAGVDLKVEADSRKKTASAPVEEIGRLQSMILDAVLSGRPLPGSAEPIRFPDFSFVLREPEALVLNKNLAPGFSLPSGSKPARIISPAEIEAQAELRGEVAFLQFQPPGIATDEVDFTLEARIARKAPRHEILGLSSCHVKFRKVAGEWQATGEPIYLAA